MPHTNGPSPLSNMSNLEKILCATSGSRTFGAGLAMGVSHTRGSAYSSSPSINASGPGTGSRSGNNAHLYGLCSEKAQCHSDGEACQYGRYCEKETYYAGEDDGGNGDASDVDHGESASESTPSEFASSSCQSCASSNSSTSSSLDNIIPAPIPECTQAHRLTQTRSHISTQACLDTITYPESLVAILNEQPPPSPSTLTSTPSCTSTAPLLNPSGPAPPSRRNRLSAIFHGKVKHKVPAPIKTTLGSLEKQGSAGSLKSPMSPLFDWRFRNLYAVRNVAAGQAGRNRISWGYGL